jgi:hypothetical protein
MMKEGVNVTLGRHIILVMLEMGAQPDTWEKGGRHRNSEETSKL